MLFRQITDVVNPKPFKAFNILKLADYLEEEPISVIATSVFHNLLMTGLFYSTGPIATVVLSGGFFIEITLSVTPFFATLA